MKPLLLCLAVLVAALFSSLVARALTRQRRDEARWPFMAQTPLSQVEQVLFFRLQRTLPEQVVLAQVQLSRFLRVRKGRTWREWHDRISQKSIDYLVCDPDFTILCAIELDDGSHEGSSRVDADLTKSRALAAAQVPLIRWHAGALPTSDAIRSLVAEIRRDRFGDVGAVTPGGVEPSPSASRIDASNDATMFTEDTHQ